LKIFHQVAVGKILKITSVLLDQFALLMLEEMIVMEVNLVLLNLSIMMI